MLTQAIRTRRDAIVLGSIEDSLPARTLNEIHDVVEEVVGDELRLACEGMDADTKRMTGLLVDVEVRGVTIEIDTSYEVSAAERAAAERSMAKRLGVSETQMANGRLAHAVSAAVEQQFARSRKALTAVKRRAVKTILLALADAD